MKHEQFCSVKNLFCVLQLWRIDKETFKFRVFNKQFVGLDGYNVVTISNSSIDSETFHIVKENDNSILVRIKPSNGGREERRKKRR